MFFYSRFCETLHKLWRMRDFLLKNGTMIDREHVSVVKMTDIFLLYFFRDFHHLPPSPPFCKKYLSSSSFCVVISKQDGTGMASKILLKN